MLCHESEFEDTIILQQDEYLIEMIDRKIVELDENFK